VSSQQFTRNIGGAFDDDERYDKYNLEANNSLSDIYDQTTQDYLKGNIPYQSILTGSGT
jgi:hypothetical protein